MESGNEKPRESPLDGERSGTSLPEVESVNTRKTTAIVRHGVERSHSQPEPGNRASGRRLGKLPAQQSGAQGRHRTAKGGAGRHRARIDRGLELRGTVLELFRATRCATQRTGAGVRFCQVPTPLFLLCASALRADAFALADMVSFRGECLYEWPPRVGAPDECGRHWLRATRELL